MFKNIFLFICLIIFTFISTILINVSITFWNELFSELSLIYKFLFIFSPILLFLYLCFIFIKALIKKELSFWYLYSYIWFLVLFTIFYIFYFSNINYPYIDEKQFDTRLSNIEVQDPDNALVKIVDLLKNNNAFILEVFNLKDFSTDYLCFIENKDCDKNEIIQKYNNIIVENSEEISEISTKVKNIWETKYLKFDYKSGNFPNLLWLREITRFSLYQEIYYLDKNNKDKALDILISYLKFWDRLMIWDSILITTIIWNSIINSSLGNLEYILDNYNLDKNSAKYKELVQILEEKYNSKEIIFDSIKSEYHQNKYSLWSNLKSSMIFDLEEYLNRERFLWLASLDNEKINKPSYFKREYLYHFLLSKWHDNYTWFIENIDNTNNKKEEILNKL